MSGVYYFNYVQQPNQAAVGGTNPANDRDGFQLQAGIQFAPKGMVYGGIMAASGCRSCSQDQERPDRGYDAGIRF